MSPRIRTVGAHALLLDLDDPAAVLAWDAWLRAARDRGELTATDIVPGARTVLVDGLPSRAAVQDLLSRTEPAAVPDRAADEVRIDVVWDGPDLGDVAAQWSMTSEQVVRELSGCELRVAFGGFAPGFAYLTGLPGGRTVHRRDSPRTKVPAGSVGLAGEYAGIYPRSSPGGWRLVGRTDAVLFDPERDPPALLTPGAVVRLVGG